MRQVILRFEAGLLREEIRKSGLSQRKLSKKLGLSEKSFSHKMNGLHEWKLSEIQAMKQIMPDMNISEIFHI